MMFPELCEKLIKELGSAKVRSNAYPGMGSRSSEGMGLWVHDGVFEVGFEERGEWNTDRVFETEEAACEYLYAELIWTPEVVVESPEERRQSKEITDAFERKMAQRDEYWRQYGEYPPDDA